MARPLVDHVVELLLGPADFRLREPDDQVGELVRSDTDLVVWDLIGTSWRAGAVELGGFAGDAGDRFQARATLPATRRSDGLVLRTGGDLGDLDPDGDGVYRYRYATDSEAGDDRTVRTPRLVAAGVREWKAIEPLVREPEAPADVVGAGAACTFRLWDGTDELYHDGTEWRVADAGEWNTRAELVARFPELPGNVRELALVARLGTTDGRLAPAFYGARVVYRCRQVDALDDALIRTVLASLRDELQVPGVAVWNTTAITSSVNLADEVSGEFAYDVQAVLAAFNLTDDPDELAELPGTFAAGVWTPTTPIASGKQVRLEFSYLPHLVASLHYEAAQLETLPAVYLAATGEARVVQPGGDFEVRDTTAAVPTSERLRLPASVIQPVEVRLVAGLASDVRRLRQALATWLGEAGARILISPETGELIEVRQVAPPADTGGAFAQGVVEARAGWLLTYPRAGRETTTTTNLLRPSGLTVTTD